jgi:hypothetical protein
MCFPRFEVFSYKGSNHLGLFKKLRSLGSSSPRERSLVILWLFMIGKEMRGKSVIDALMSTLLSVLSVWGHIPPVMNMTSVS